jgi:hypothetical protein
LSRDQQDLAHLQARPCLPQPRAALQRKRLREYVTTASTAEGERALESAGTASVFPRLIFDLARLYGHAAAAIEADQELQQASLLQASLSIIATESSPLRQGCSCLDTSSRCSEVGAMQAR